MFIIVWNINISSVSSLLQKQSHPGMDTGSVGGGGTTLFHWKNFGFIGKNLDYIRKIQKIGKEAQKMA